MPEAAIRQTALGELKAGDLDERPPRFTARARTVVRLAIDQARAGGAPNVGTGHLLAGMLTEGENLALHVLKAVEIDPALVPVPSAHGVFPPPRPASH